MAGSYMKAVLVPWEQFQRLKSPGGNTASATSSHNVLLPPDVRLKLLRQERLNSKHKHQTESLLPGATSGKTYPTKADIDVIVDSIPEKWRPYARSILLKILDYPDQISWKENFELVLNNQTLANTNIVELMQLILKEKVITRVEDIPFGAKDFYNALLQIGIPKTWLRINLNPRRTKRKRAKRARWLAYDSDDDDDDTIVAGDDD